MTNRKQDFLLALRECLAAPGFIWKHHLLKYALFSLLIGVLLWSLFFGLIVCCYPFFFSKLEPIWQNWNSELSWGSWTWDILIALFYVSLLLLTGFLFYVSLRFILLTILSPMLSHLSEKVEILERESNLKAREGVFWSDLKRAGLLSLRNFPREISLVLFFGALSFIPVVGMLFSFCVFLVSAYFAGFSFMDFYLERKEYPVKLTADFVWRRSGFCMGIGLVFLLTFWVPIVGVLLGPIISVVAATRGLVKMNLDED